MRCLGTSILCVLFLDVLFQYLELIRSLESYNTVKFPHCMCDARKDGHIRLIVSLSEIRLQACDTDGISEVRIHLQAAYILLTHMICFYTGPRTQFPMGHAERP